MGTCQIFFSTCKIFNLTLIWENNLFPIQGESSFHFWKHSTFSIFHLFYFELHFVFFYQKFDQMNYFTVGNGWWYLHPQYLSNSSHFQFNWLYSCMTTLIQWWFFFCRIEIIFIFNQIFVSLKKLVLQNNFVATYCRIFLEYRKFPFGIYPPQKEQYPFFFSFFFLTWNMWYFTIWYGNWIKFLNYACCNWKLSKIWNTVAAIV